MKLNSQDLRALHDEACAIAREAGELVAAYAPQNVAVAYKQAGENLASQIVTEVDYKSDALIVERLQASMKRYDIGLLTEERKDDDSRFEKDYFWCVDPLDGTLAFTQSPAGYAISIALVSKAGVAQIGVVFDPVSSKLYSAIVGQGARRNALEWAPNLDALSSKFTLPVDRNQEQQDGFSTFRESLDAWSELHGYSQVKFIRQAGAVMNAISVLEHAPAIYFKRPKCNQGGGSVWDFAATVCIFHELGAISSSFQGEPLNLNPSDSTFMNQSGVVFASCQQALSVGLLET